MKSKALLISLIIVTFAAVSALMLAYFIEPTFPENCGKRSLLNDRACQEWERQILSSTARIILESWAVKPDETGYDIDYSTGHATVMNGRYLVTHNHFKLPFIDLRRPNLPESYVVVYLYNSSGELLFKGPLSEFELVGDDIETLVIAHKDEGFFERLGFDSAEFQAWANLPIAAGMTVAQIDWDGERTHVDWVTVKNVIVEQGAPRLVLANSVRPGASGGGIFWKGVHVANTWRVEERIDAEGKVVGAVTTVALNTAEVLIK